MFFADWIVDPIIVNEDSSEDQATKPSREKNMKYTNEEKFQLGQLCAKFKKEYDESKSGAQEYWCTKRKKIVQRHAAQKDGYLSRAIREFYKDLANIKESDPTFGKAKSLARRSLKYYNTVMENTQDMTPEHRETEMLGFRSSLVGRLGRPSRQLTEMRAAMKKMEYPEDTVQEFPGQEQHDLGPID